MPGACLRQYHLSSHVDRKTRIPCFWPKYRNLFHQLIMFSAVITLL